MYNKKESCNFSAQNKSHNYNKRKSNIQKNADYDSTEIKSDVIDYLYNCIDVSRYKYRLLRTFDDLKSLKEIEHLVSPNFSGKNGFIIFKKFKKGFFSILIDRKTLKYNKSTLDLNSVRFIPLNIKARVDIYNGTILDGKLIKIDNGKSIFLITDVFYLEGKDMTEDKIENKLINIKSYLDKYIKVDKKMSKITFDINKLYNYNQITEMVMDNKNHSVYNMYGIIFYPPKSGITILFNDLEEINTVTESTDHNNTYAHIQLKKRDLPDVYDTYILNDDDKLAKTGIAYIPTLKLSRYCCQVFSSVSNNSPIIFKSIFNTDYQKWLPIEKIDNITKPDTLKRVRELLATN